MTRTILVDIGGTNTRVGLAQNGVLDDASILRFRNSEFAGLDAVIAAYFSKNGAVQLDGACVDIAGPVHSGVGTLTNLDWTLTEAKIAAWTGAKQALLINDLQAQGHGVADLPPESLYEVETSQSTSENHSETRLVVNVGTGFNAAVVYDTDGARHVPASEAGHANLPVRTAEDLSLAQFVESTHGFPAIEDVLSGRGLESVYQWLDRDNGQDKRFSGAEIIALCHDGDATATKAVQVFCKFFGTVSGNLSLVHLPFGGVYLVGGVACALAPLLKTMGFVSAFRDKGRFGSLVGQFSVYVIEDDYAALRGASRHLHAVLSKKIETA